MDLENAPKDTKLDPEDPLGVIEQYAKEVWKDRGRPSGTTWKGFVDEAKERLLAERGAPERPATQKLPHSAPVTLPKEIADIRQQKDDAFVADVAHVSDTLLNEHEVFCVATLLASNEFKLANGDYHAPSEQEIIRIIAQLAGEYDGAFLDSEGQGNLKSISQDKLCDYWKSKLLQWQKEDRPLNFHDRNTIKRLEDAMLKHSTIQSVRHCSGGK